MSNIIKLHPAAKNRQEVYEKASLWIVRLSAGASDKDLQEIHAWFDEHPDNVKVLMDAACIWDQVSVLSELSAIFPLQEYLTPQPVKVRRSVMYSGLVACLLLASLHGPILGWLKGGGSSQDPETLQLSYETRIGQQSTIVLPDGSEVVLNTNTRIDISFSSAYRDIILHRGEGYFTVAKSSSRPFRVYANGGVVEAVGTAFTVQQLQQETLEVTVLEGEVNFTRTSPAEPGLGASLPASPDQSSLPIQPPSANTVVMLANAVAEPISLKVGESVQINESDDRVRKQAIAAVEMESKLAWRNGMLLFQGDSLEEAIRQVSRYTTIQIDVDEKVRDVQVLGNFRTGDIEGMLLSMSLTFNIQVEWLSEQHIVLKAAN